MTGDQQNRIVKVATGERKAELVFKQVRYVNIFTNEILQNDIAIQDGYIAGIGEYEGEKEINSDGILIPGLIDGHIHMESSMISPLEFAKAVVPHGTTTVITDPHEIANVAGTKGIDFLMEETKSLPLDVYFMLPSCVPATGFDESGAILLAKDLDSYYGNSRVLGLAEMMNYPGTIHLDDTVHDKIKQAKSFGKRIDGHAPGLKGKELNGYIAAGIASDHECSTSEEAIHKLSLGQWIMVREGTAARNMEALLPLFEAPYYERCILVTDDKHPGDLIEQGHIDYIIRKAISLGADPYHVLRMATYNTATYFNLQNVGAIAPGYKADITVVNNLSDIRVEAVYKAGENVKEIFNLIARKDSLLEKSDLEKDDVHLKKNGKHRYADIYESFRMNMLKPKDFMLKNKSKYTRVIEMQEGEILTNERIIENLNGIDVDRDLLEVAVIERHRCTGHIGVAFLNGYGLKKGAVASSVAHDSHNIIVVGVTEEDMCIAANQVFKNQGGLAVSCEGQMIGDLALPIAGLMCNKSAAYVESKLRILKNIVRSLGVNDSIDPFMTLAFMSLPVIPKLKVTTKGLVDVEKQEIVD
jgi:adenine deaminase